MSRTVTPRRTDDFHFRVADTVFRLTFRDRTDGRALIPSYAPFYVEEEEDRHSPYMEGLLFHLTVEAGTIDLAPVSEKVGTFDSGDAIHEIYRLLGGGYKIIITTASGHSACAMETNERFTQCRATLQGTIEDQTFGLNNALMIAFAFAGAHHRLLLMHASVTMNGDRAYLFLGPSGTGKSTHSALWRQYIPGSDLLNDDNPAVRAMPDAPPMVYGTPWSGKTPCYRPLSRIIGAVVRLEQAPENHINRLPAVPAFAGLLSSCSTMIWDAPSYNAILTTVECFAATTPVYHLCCRPDKEAAQICYSAVSQPV